MLLIRKQLTILFLHITWDVKSGTNQSDMLPSLATRVKNKLQIKPKCVAYDILFDAR
jgi:3-oxoacyl-[acyl-carrier-protein] synthase-3